MNRNFENELGPVLQSGQAKPAESDRKAPIDFTASLAERRQERMRRREERNSLDPAEDERPKSDVRQERQERRARLKALAAAAPKLEARPMAEEPRQAAAGTEARDDIRVKQSKGFLSLLRRSMTVLSFLLMVALPTAATVYYYYFIASPQYRIEAQFSVRGSNSSATSLLGLGAMFGNSVQSGDSYIVVSYLESIQLIRDLKTKQDIDLRTFFASDAIDFMYRIDPAMPIEEFVSYWQRMTEVSFNSTTGNVTFYLYAFDAADAKVISDAVMKASEELVNNLSENSRQQMTRVASMMVNRAEERLRKAREELTQLRLDGKALNPEQILAMQNALTNNIEGQLSTLRARLAAVQKSTSEDTPSAKVIRRQIVALEQQLELQRSRVGQVELPAGEDNSAKPSGNLSEVMANFEKLNTELTFATQAYTSALSGLESAYLEAQKQERYFATFVTPDVPSVSLYPSRLIDSIMFMLIYLAAWLLAQFIFRSVRDHAV